MYKVSVIIPAYNTEEYIGKCLESLLNQTLQEIEIVVVDDGSTDETLKILRKYESENSGKIKVFSKPNGGQASARNLALQHVQGEYVGFVDSDDWVECNMYENMYCKAIKENADIVACDMVEVFPDKEVYHNYTKVDGKFYTAASACNKIFKRDLATSIKFPEGFWYEDFEYTTKQLMRTDNISLLSEGLYRYLYRETSTMHNNNAQKNLDILSVLQHLEDYAAENMWKEKYAELLEYLYIDHVLLTAINRVEEQNNSSKKEIIKKLAKVTRDKYPRFSKSPAFKKFSKKQQLVILLNSYGLSNCVTTIFAIKRFLLGKK